MGGVSKHSGLSLICFNEGTGRFKREMEVLKRESYTCTYTCNQLKLKQLQWLGVKHIVNSERKIEWI